MAQKLYEFETLAARQEEIEEMLRRLYNPGLDGLRPVYDQLVRDLQNGYVDLAADATSPVQHDGRDPRPPIRRQFIQPAPAKPVPTQSPGIKAPSLDKGGRPSKDLYNKAWDLLRKRTDGQEPGTDGFEAIYKWWRIQTATRRSRSSRNAFMKAMKRRL